jgi:hypothetical protein
VPLLAHRVGFAQPGLHLVVQIFHALDLEVVHVAPGRDGLDPREARMLEPPCENDVGSPRFLKTTSAKIIRTWKPMRVFAGA